MHVRQRCARALVAPLLALAPLAIATPAAALADVEVWFSGGCLVYQRGTDVEVEVTVVETVAGALHDVALSIDMPAGLTATFPTEPRTVAGLALFRGTISVGPDVATGDTPVATLTVSSPDGVLATTQWQGNVVGAPSAPTGVVATPGDEVAHVSWTAPADLGWVVPEGKPSPYPHRYEIVASPGGAKAIVRTDGTSAVVPGLDNGTAYTFTVTAWNYWGQATSAAAAPVTPARVPRAPTAVSATGSGASRLVSWTPSAEAAAPATGWTVTSYPGGLTATAGAGATSATVEGLSADVAYEFGVRATSASGDGHQGFTAPVGLPGPFAGTLTVEDDAVRIQDPTAGIVSVDVQLFPEGNVTNAWSSDLGDWSMPLVGDAGSMTGLRVRAVNATGPGEWSSPSDAVAVPAVRLHTVGLSELPVAGNGSAWLCFHGSPGGGSDVTGYVAVAEAVGADEPVHTATFPAGARSGWLTGLTNGVQYKLDVYVLTAAFPDPPAEPAGNDDVRVTPVPPPGTVSGVVATRGDGSATVEWDVTGPAPYEAYVIEASPGGARLVSPGMPDAPVPFEGLANGTAYTFTVTAVSRSGESAGVTSNAVTPAGVPAAVGGLTAVPDPAAPGSALVSWTAPSGNGSAVTGYDVLVQPGAIASQVTGTSVSIPLADGTYTVAVNARNAVGAGSATTSDPVTIDTVLPTTTVNVPSVTLSGVVTATVSSSEPGIRALRYRVARYDGLFGAYRALPGTQVTVRPGWTYCFSGRTTDDAGNAGAWSAEDCTAAPLDDRSLSASAGWSRGTSAGYYLGTYSATLTKGATLTKTGVRARRLGLVATTCATCGKAGVYLDGVLARTVNLYSATTRYRQVVSVDLGRVKAGTVTIRALSGRVHVDGLLASRVL